MAEYPGETQPLTPADAREDISPRQQKHEPESVLYERLCGLIRDLHRDKQAGEIVAAFDAVFGASDDEESRRSLLDYWLDFYRLQKYKQLKQRRRPKVQDRLVTCAACGYPSSHRHHLWDFATHGENNVTIHLCANCHELNHLMYNALVKQSDYSRDILRHVMFSGDVKAEVVTRILGWCLATIRYEANNGWLDGSRGSKEAVETRLGWSEFLRHSAAQAMPEDEPAPRAKRAERK